VLDALSDYALSNYAQTKDPFSIGQLIMAAPDVDRDNYRQDIKSISKIVSGMTLYASAADEAMRVSRKLAGGPRAGEVLNHEPTMVDGVDAIDVTAIGNEIFGLNHTVSQKTDYSLMTSTS
jgi:esterase/lipase superfamily enzyme